MEGLWCCTTIRNHRAGDGIVQNHYTINHSINFVDPDSPEIHTQNIEGLWSRSKFYLRKENGISQEQDAEYLVQFIWEYSID